MSRTKTKRRKDSREQYTRSNAATARLLTSVKPAENLRRRLIEHKRATTGGSWRRGMVTSTTAHCRRNIELTGTLVSHYYILVIRNFIDFTPLFRHSVWFSFSFKQFPSESLEYATYLRIADKNGRRVELSSSVLLQTLGKLKSLQGTELSVVVVIFLLGSFWILTLDSRCWLIVINEVKCYEVWMFIQLWYVEL